MMQRDAKDFVEIVLEDNGIGFEQQFATKIFETFARLNSKDTFEGTGLGLALCKKTVDRYNGTIEAQSALSEGASFIITLPIKQSESGSYTQAPVTIIADNKMKR